ncbi:hypothetical protein FKM82_023873 [Ascaphus truei]
MENKQRQWSGKFKKQNIILSPGSLNKTKRVHFSVTSESTGVDDSLHDHTDSFELEEGCEDDSKRSLPSDNIHQKELVSNNRDPLEFDTKSKYQRDHSRENHMQQDFFRKSNKINIQNKRGERSENGEQPQMRRIRERSPYRPTR